MRVNRKRIMTIIFLVALIVSAFFIPTLLVQRVQYRSAVDIMNLLLALVFPEIILYSFADIVLFTQKLE